MKQATSPCPTRGGTPIPEGGGDRESLFWALRGSSIVGAQRKCAGASPPSASGSPEVIVLRDASLILGELGVRWLHCLPGRSLLSGQMNEHLGTYGR